MSSVKKTILKNGLRIALIPKSDSLTTTVLVLVEAGSKYETKDINGISHFLEHMCFKGTKKRPRSIDIASELDGIGANYNAFTSMEYTGYYAKARGDNFDGILDVISDIYLNQVFAPEEIDKERGVIVEEINMYEDLPMRRVQELFTSLLYGDQPAGWDIAGRKEVIEKLKKNDFLEYRRKHYLASATAVTVAGSFDEKTVLKKIEKAFGGISAGKKFPKEKTTENQEKPEILLKHKETDQTHLVLGVRAYDIFDRRKYAIQLLADVLGGGMSSRLFQKIREEMGAAYYVRAETDFFTDHGYLAISVGVDHNKLDKVISAIVEEFKKICEKKIDGKQLQKFKNHLTGNLILNLETSDELASFYGDQEILVGKFVSPKELIERIQKIEPEDVLAVAKDIFQNRKLNLALIGPFKEKEKFEKIMRL